MIQSVSDTVVDHFGFLNVVPCFLKRHSLLCNVVQSPGVPKLLLGGRSACKYLLVMVAPCNVGALILHKDSGRKNPTEAYLVLRDFLC